MAALFLTPSMPRLLRALDKDWTAKPLHPTSIGRHLALHPDCWQLLTNSSYLASFLSKASSKRYSQGTVSFNSTACLVDSDRRTISSPRVVAAMWLGNFSCHSRSTNSCQSPAVARMPADVLAVDIFGCLPPSDEADGSLGGLGTPGPLSSCTDGFSYAL